MNFTCAKKDLIEAFNIVSKAVAAKAQLPILTGIYMKAEGSSLELQANNYEIGIITRIPVNTEDPGEIVVVGKYIQDIIRNLSGDIVTIQLDEERHVVNISSEGTKFDILSMNAEDFPKVKSPEIFSTFSIRTAILKNLIRKTVYACANDEVRPIFSGACMDIADNVVSMVATNTHRIAIMKEKLDDQTDNLAPVVIPAKTLLELSRMLDSSDLSNTVKIECSQKNICFTFDNIYMTARLIDGQFPPYDKVIPKESATIVTIDVEEMLRAVECISIISKVTEYNTIRFIFSQDGLNISSTSPDVGRAEEQINAHVEGPDIDISFNVRYITEVLKVLDTDECVIKLNKPLSPIDLREKDNDDFIYVVTPVRTS